MAINEKYSFKSFKRKQFIGLKPDEFNNSEIVGACFHQDQPFTDVFPVDVSKVTLTRCNLDNCNIPAGATVNGGTNKHFKIQNDGEYWIVDSSMRPTAPRDSAKFDAAGISKLPANIPAAKTAEPVTIANDPKRILDAKLAALRSDDAKLLQIIAAEDVAKAAK